MDNQTVRCRHCTATFKREDHRRRHELTHAEPRYQCRFPDCGMRFHRTDVLKRHEEVHVPNPSKKRRRPRRGADPKIKDSSEDVSEDDVEEPLTVASAIEGLCPDCGRVCTVCKSCLNVLFDSTNLPIECHKPLLFCATHCVEFQMRRFAFIHHATARVKWIRNGRLLAMAALGGLGIAEYRSAAQIFFNEALRCFLDYPPGPENPYPGQPLDGMSRALLTSFQTRIMLVEYGAWSQDHSCETWAFEELMRMAAYDIRKIVDMYNAVSTLTEKDWRTDLLEEEISRTAWSFYCLQVRVSVVFNMPSNVLQALKDVRLPGPESSFNPPNEHDVPVEDPSPPPSTDTSFQHALFILLSNKKQYHPSLARVSPFAQYILVHALVELYDVALTVPHNFPTLEAFTQRQKPRLQTQDTFWRAIDIWSDHFRAASEELWQRGRPETFARLQSNLMIDYLAVRMTDTDQGPQLEEPWAREAVERTIAMSESMAMCGILNVATKAHWMCDRASWWYACRMAKAQHLWAVEAGRFIEKGGGGGASEVQGEGGSIGVGGGGNVASEQRLLESETALLHRIADVVKQMRRDSGSARLPSDDSAEFKLERVSGCVEKMWNLLLGTEGWRD